ncbi:MAG: hypothetical protein ACE5HS_09045 [bacterium]
MTFDANRPYNDLPLLPPATPEKTGILSAHKLGKEMLYLNRSLYDLLSR